MPDVLFDVSEGIATITINRPEARNAVNGAVALAIAEAVDQIDARHDIQVSILTGAGGFFCAGMDLKAFLKGENVKPFGRGFAGLTNARVRKPLIAAVEGMALAGGFELALACDLIVASEVSQFGLPEVKRGLVANAGGLVRLPRQLPHRLAMEMVLTGASVSAQALLAHGLINRVVPAGQVMGAALELAATIAANGPMAVAVSKQVLVDSQDWPSTELFVRQDEFTLPVFKSHDAKEGATAFAEKRKPVWKGI
ncbi:MULTISPECIES: crotonase/enoyl-CoA hydratase family protein [unclassified Pseudomonas]|uniref:crotonase/enoyl-CoA hydratase family protein n=1 Tax=unclassified Pseudomonas TaxID=196821 RepID=UPI0008718C4E|nr:MULTISPECIES: crotonase/enoyl-CoA hydratase family protein [unclassified Pseudomonas]SCW99111.1 short chain enoyl-CoA hydratase [Pseudomonas sp. NFACC56-3]SFK88045.1 short chain enoyl-CoA hydratase [Pseudomonas sp. NFACC52]